MASRWHRNERKPASHLPRGFEETGESRPMKVSDWWCPTEERWSMCPGPCPDGTAHGPERVSVVQSKVLRRVGG